MKTDVFLKRTRFLELYILFLYPLIGVLGLISILYKLNFIAVILSFVIIGIFIYVYHSNKRNSFIDNINISMIILLSKNKFGIDLTGRSAYKILLKTKYGKRNVGYKKLVGENKDIYFKLIDDEIIYANKIDGSYIVIDEVKS